jgi:hypothetical protein
MVALFSALIVFFVAQFRALIFELYYCACTNQPMFDCTGKIAPVFLLLISCKYLPIHAASLLLMSSVSENNNIKQGPLTQLHKTKENKEIWLYVWEVVYLTGCTVCVP